MASLDRLPLTALPLPELVTPRCSLAVMLRAVVRRVVGLVAGGLRRW